MTSPAEPREVEKPLRVKVAEAIGLDVRDESRWCLGQCVQSPSESGAFPKMIRRDEPHYHEKWLYFRKYEWENDGEWEDVPDFTVRWDFTGPLIEAHGITLIGRDDPEWRSGDNGSWLALWPLGMGWKYEEKAHGPTPLIAACRLILSLSAAGKLDK